MANDFVQTMVDARVDARSLSDFVFKPAGFKVARRLAPPIDTLQFYIDRLDAYVTTIPNIVNDAINNTAVEGGVLADTFVTVTANGTGSVARTQRDKNSDVISVKDFGAIGDGLYHPLSERYSSLALAQFAYPNITVTSLNQSIDWAAIQNALNSGVTKIHAVEGTYVITDTLQVHDGQTLVGDGTGAWRAAPFSSTSAVGIYGLDTGTNFLFWGTGEKYHELDFVTASTQCGYDRPNVAAVYNDDFDSTMYLTDFTNKDASGTTRATLRKFSCGVILGDANEQTMRPARMEAIRVVTSCTTKSTPDTDGYAEQKSIVPWSHWDVGVWCKMPWHTQIIECQVVGYWDMIGLLATSMSESAPNVTYSGGMAEFFDIRGGIIQSGLSIRSGDIFPILAKTDTTLSVEWTASHRFESSGMLFTDGGSVTYDGLTYDGDTNRLTFNNVSNTSFVDVSHTGNTTVIRCTPNAGWANSVIEGVEIVDFGHSTRTVEQSKDFGVHRMPIRAALEISGHPTRGIKFNNCSFFGVSPKTYHFGNARDIEFNGCYSEPKGYRNTLSSFSEPPSSSFIVGAKASYAPYIPTYDRGYILSWGNDFTIMLNMHPYLKPVSGRRMSDATDMFNPRSMLSQRENIPLEEGFLTLKGFNGESVKIESRSTGGFPREGFLLDSSGNVSIAPEHSTNYTYLRSGHVKLTSSEIELSSTLLKTGEGSPEGVVTARKGSLYLRTDGGDVTTLWIKTSGVGNTGWISK